MERSDSSESHSPGWCLHTLWEPEGGRVALKRYPGHKDESTT